MNLRLKDFEIEGSLPEIKDLVEFLLSNSLLPVNSVQATSDVVATQSPSDIVATQSPEQLKESFEERNLFVYNLQNGSIDNAFASVSDCSEWFNVPVEVVKEALKSNEPLNDYLIYWNNGENSLDNRVCKFLINVHNFNISCKSEKDELKFGDFLQLVQYFNLPPAYMAAIIISSYHYNGYKFTLLKKEVPDQIKSSELEDSSEQESVENTVENTEVTESVKFAQFKAKRVAVYSEDSKTLIEICPSVSYAANKYGGHAPAYYTAIRTGKKYKGYIWKWADLK